ncbi:MAG TPA: DNA circularization N-terminal domain-containing protein [Xanthobacteraceae bacterium]|nr:DNA circularization N-terminal domain-containing protein [Xanthobacteraceae bacterium]
MARNWLTTLWAASFRGVPFQTETDSVGGGRRVVAHEFPMRDDPFLEDLGESKRSFDLTAYVASDNADGEAAALIAACSQRGPAILVLPLEGPITVRCLEFSRSREKDRAGKVAFTLKFLRQGAASSLLSVASLANLVFVAADALVGIASANYAQSVTVAGQPEQVVSAAVSAIQDGAATFDALRTSEPVDVAVSATQRDALQAIYDTAGILVGSDPEAVAAALTGSAQAIGDGMSGEAAVRAFGPVVDSLVAERAPSYPTRNARRADANRVAGYRVARLAGITAYAEAVVRVSITDRPAGITLRADVAEMFERELNGLRGGDMALNTALVDLRNVTIDYLSRAILDAAPVVTVEANAVLPSLWWAFRLYRDPLRSREIAARNLVPHPSLMPTKFEALAR